MRKMWVLLLLYVAMAAPSTTQTKVSPFEFAATPIASLSLTDSALFGTGSGASLCGEFGLFTPGLRLGPEISFVTQPLQDNAGGFLIASLGARASYELTLLPWLVIVPNAQAGFFLGLFSGSPGQPGFDAYFGGGLTIGFLLTHNFGLALESGYRVYMETTQALDLGLGATLRLGAGRNAGTTPAPKPTPLKSAPPSGLPVSAAGLDLQIAGTTFDPVFPVLFKYYNDHPVGKITLKNTSLAPVQNVRVSFFVNQYMDNPKPCPAIPEIDPGAEASMDLLALFNNNMLTISEGTMVSARISIDYEVAGSARSQETVGTVRIYDRNASMWDDNRKAAAFVTSKDPTILRFSKNVLAMIKGKGSKAVNPNLLTAMAMHEATLIYGLTYVTDPSNSYAATLESKTAVDFLQFPRQTLDYKGGNCSALSILYAALLESVGIETAFITVPGHIFMAISLGIPPDQARKDFSAPDDLILTKDRAWLPIETTERSAGFLQAWQDGAKEWRENLARQQADLYPVHEAWAVYEPVGFASDTENIPLPDGDKVVAAYLEELVHYIDSEIYPQVAKLQADIRSTNNSPKSVNELGVLYARYGLYDRAEVQFKAALKGGTYAPALVNLGNLAYLGQKYDAALDYYNQAQKVEPANPTVLLAVARANHALENYGVAKAAYDKLKAAAPDLAQQFAYLDLKGEESTRAADIAGISDVVVWGEEQ